MNSKFFFIFFVSNSFAFAEDNEIDDIDYSIEDVSVKCDCNKEIYFKKIFVKASDWKVE